MELEGLMLVILLLNYASSAPLIAARDVVDAFVQHIKYRVDFLKQDFIHKIS
jgi:hypothetical protein